MPVQILKSKLFVPPQRPNLVARPRLLQALNEGLSQKRKLTLSSAPAGFGKTTLLVAWLKQIELPAAWLSIDEADNDLPRFLTHFAAAFQQVDEAVGSSLLAALQSPQLPPLEKALTDLLNEIASRPDPLILVLDDFHLLTNEAALRGVEFVLEHQPPQLHLVLITREDPDLPLARLRARDQLTEIRARDLRFTRKETDLFLRSVMGLELSGQQVAALEGRTEGWAAGLQLAALSMQKQDDPGSFIAEFSGSHRHILDYLTGEVLQHQPQDIRDFLLQTSILERLSAPLCDALTGRTDSEAVLRRLEAANLFVIPLDEERRWYRYHHLFAELLRSQLSRTQAGMLSELHRRASSWFEESGDIQSAVDHALRDPDFTQAEQLVEKYAFPMLFQGEVPRVVSWFDRLPERCLDSAPMLCIGKAWARVLMQRGGRMGEVERYLQVAQEVFEHQQAGQDLRNLVDGHSACIRSFLLSASQISEQPDKLIALSHQALQLLPESERGIRSTAALNIGYGSQASMDLEKANQAFQQALEDGLAGGNYYAAIYGPINLVFSSIWLGDLEQALNLCETHIGRFNTLMAGRYFAPLGALYILKGCILLEKDCLPAAEAALTEGLDLVRWTGDAVVPRRGWSALARLRGAQGSLAGMLAVFKEMEESWPEGDRYTQSLRHRLCLRHMPGDPGVQEQARSWLAGPAPSFNNGMTVVQSVDPGSNSRFEIQLNAAHVLARLVMQGQRDLPVEDALDYLERQEAFAKRQALLSWVIETQLARAVLQHACGKRAEALQALEQALVTAAPTGFLRVFLDDCDPMGDLLEELRPRLGEGQAALAGRLLEAFEREEPKPEAARKADSPLSERELEVLRSLAGGLSYEEIGRQLFLSLNTVQFHVKNIYRKLLVNRRVQAIDKARELHLI